jgi:protease-3
MRRELDFFGQFKLKRAFMGDHPANRFLIGNLETLGDKEGSKLHPETVEFYEQFYSANIMKLAMLSNLGLDEMEKLARKHFSSIENKKIAKPVVQDQMPSFGKQRVYYVPNNDVKQIRLDFTIKNNMDQFKYKPNYFVNYLVGSEMPGTPAFILKEMGLISSLNGSSSANQYGNYGNLQINISLTDKGMEQREFIVATVMNYINMIRENGVDEKYFKEIQTSLDNQFRFLQKIDEFSYVSNLAQNMQDYPVANVINAPYYYNTFNKDAIDDTLGQLTPENLLIWYVSKAEKADQEMHFYAGKYRKEPISNEEIDSWAKPSKLALSLPDVNRLLPENFDLYTKASKEGDKPELAYDNEGVQIWNFPSQYFATQPRGVIRLMINNPAEQTDPAAEVMNNIWASMFNLQQSALATEASIAGMNMFLSSSNGLMVNISGFTDKQGMLLEEAFKKLKVDVTEENFKQAIDRYVRGVKNSEKGFAYTQVIGKYQRLIASGNYENDTLIKTAESLTPKQFVKFMQDTMANNHVRAFTYGNYSKQDIATLANRIESMLPDDRRVTEYSKTRYWQPQKGKTVVYRADIPVEDVALIDLYVHPKPGYASKAAAGILQSHYRRSAFNTLRTEEQLAYAVTALSTSIDEYSAVGLLIQTPVKNVVDMQKRFDEFNQAYAKEVEAITEEEFNTLKASRLTTLREKPKNLGEEVTPLINDWTRENLDFDSQLKLIEATEKVTLADLKQYFKDTVGNTEAARLSVQLRGKKFADQPYFEFGNEEVVKDLATFHAKTTYQ